MREAVGKIRTIHPGVLTEIDEVTALTLLEVARDLRSGKIAKPLFYMGDFEKSVIYKGECKTACCIAGWAAVYQKTDWEDLWFPSSTEEGANERGQYLRDGKVWGRSDRLQGLFSGSHPNDPQWAADAIEAYVFDYAERPWWDTQPGPKAR